MLVLLAIGIVHVCMIWEGDILFLYALIGFLLPLFRKCTNRQLLILSAFFILSPILIDIIKILFHFHWGAWFQEKAQAADVRNGIPLDKSYATWLYEPGNSWERWRKWTDSGYLYRFAYILATNRIPKVLGLFLLGFYIGRNLMYRQLDQHQSLLRFITKWGFIIGIPLNIALAHFDRDGKEIPDPAGMIDTVLNAFGVVPLSLAYIGSICLLWMKSRPAGFLKLLTAPGRMALTNYLSQSIIGILLFYSLGLGLGGDIGPSIFFPAAAGIFLFQVLFSNWWLQYFQFGPLEWLWRQLTYGKRLSIRKPRQPQ